jgi:carbonic anhydrase
MKTWLILPAVLATTFITDPPDHGHAPQPAHPAPSHTAPAAHPPATPTKHESPAKRLDPAPLPPRLPTTTTSSKDPLAAAAADQAFTQLKEGNDRWVANSPTHPNTNQDRRQDTAQGQKPFAAILTCADSRLPAERLFDRGVGDLFTIRVAGNVAGDSEIGTIEYGVEHLKVPLLVVMGHTKCGAVAAAASQGQLHGKVATLVAHIKPAVERASRNNPRATPDDLARLAVKENVWQTIYDLLKDSDICREKVATGQVRVIGAVFDITTGKVDWLGEHPWQTELLGALQPRTATAPADSH